MKSEFFIARLERALVERPNDPSLHYEFGHYFFKQGEWVRAQRSLEKAATLDPRMTRASFELGICYTRLRNYESAIREWEKMTDHDQDLNLDDIDYSRGQDIAGALQEWDRYRASAPDDIFKFYYLGIAALVLGRPQQAMIDFDKVVAFNPNFNRVRYYRGRAQHRLGKFMEAGQEFMAQLESRPRDFNSLYFAGACLVELGRTPQALQAFNRALQERPVYVKLHVKMGTAYANMMQFDQATECFRKALNVQPNLFQAHFELARCLEKQYLMDEAVEAYEKALEIRPTYKEAALSLGFLLKNLGKHVQALQYLKRVIELDPNEAEAYYLAGVILSALNRYAEAVPQYQKALRIQPRHSYAHYALGKALLKCDQVDEAIEAFRQALEQNERDSQSRTALGMAYFQKGQHALARRQFEKVVEANPRDAEAQYFLGVVHFKQHAYDLAIEAYQNAANLHPNSALRYFTQGAFHSYNRQYDHAIEEYKKATELRPDTEADLQLFAVLQLQATVGLNLAQQGRELQKFALAQEEVFIRFVQAISSALDAKDPYTRFHSKQVAYIGTRLAQQLGLPDDKLKEIMIGGWLHDIGKIGIRDEVLNKAGKLTDEERKLIQRHPEIGAEILRQVFPEEVEGKEVIYRIPWDVIPMVLHHHEKWDGTGYPHGLAGEDIPYTAQIIGVADFYDALTTNRPYRKALAPGVAMNEMRQLVGKFFSPVLIDAFEAILDELVLAMPPPVELDAAGVPKLGDDAWDGLTQSWNFVLK